MRVMNFRWRDKEGYGVVADDGVIDASSAFAGRLEPSGKFWPRR